MCKQEQTITAMESAVESALESLQEIVEDIAEAAPASAAAGGSVAAGGLVGSPPLPMTLASGVPPGITILLIIIKCQVTSSYYLGM